MKNRKESDRTKRRERES